MDKGIQLLVDIKNARPSSWEIFSKAFDVVFDRFSLLNDDDRENLKRCIVSIFEGGSGVTSLQGGGYVGKGFENVYWSEREFEKLLSMFFLISDKNDFTKPIKNFNDLSPLDLLLRNRSMSHGAPQFINALPQGFFKNGLTPQLKDTFFLLFEKMSVSDEEQNSAIVEALKEKSFDFTVKHGAIPLITHCHTKNMWETFLEQGGDPHQKFNNAPLWQYVAQVSSPSVVNHVLEWASINTGNSDEFVKNEYFKKLYRQANGYTTISDLKKALHATKLPWWGLSDSEGRNPLMICAAAHASAFSLFSATRCQKMFHHRDKKDRSLGFYLLGGNVDNDKICNLIIKNIKNDILRPSKEEGGFLMQFALNKKVFKVGRYSKEWFPKFIKSHQYNDWFDCANHDEQKIHDFLMQNTQMFGLGHLLALRFIGESTTPLIASTLVCASALSCMFNYNGWREFEEVCDKNPIWDPQVLSMLDGSEFCKNKDFAKFRSYIEKKCIQGNLSNKNTDPKVRKM